MKLSQRKINTNFLNRKVETVYKLFVKILCIFISLDNFNTSLGDLLIYLRININIVKLLEVS